mmetsp:Transcript_28481/g.71551  ORF Transcript_28481/g.71551 Transcript_28481/m.71551 type:complete len:234 (+) Transcript_28481:68-769(+)
MSAPAQYVMGTDVFDGNTELMIKQEWAGIECCSFEAKNRYRISQPNGDGEGAPFLYISEDSGCLERICCSVNRSLTLKLHQGASKDGKVLMKMKKPFHIQGCICCCRPAFDITDDAETTKIGRIEDPWRCCVMDQKIYNGSGAHVLTTTGSIWQCGVCCPLCCNISFDVQRAGKTVASIEKMALSFSECCLKTNRFKIHFNEVTDAEEKKLVLGSAMLLDLQYFEQNKNNNNS